MDPKIHVPVFRLCFTCFSVRGWSGNCLDAPGTAGQLQRKLLLARQAGYVEMRLVHAPCDTCNRHFESPKLTPKPASRPVMTRLMKRRQRDTTKEAHASFSTFICAGGGNRTPIYSLEESHPTTERHPPSSATADYLNTIPNPLHPFHPSATTRPDTQVECL